MKNTLMTMFSLAAVATSLAAMPTNQELMLSEGIVKELMRPDIDAVNARKKTPADVAKSALELAKKAVSMSEKLLLLKGAYFHYVWHGSFDKAIDVLRTIKVTIPDIPPKYMANIIESAASKLPKNRGLQIHRILDGMKSYIRHQDELKADLAKSARKPRDRALHVAIAEHYVYLGDWPNALDEFAKGDNPKAAAAAKAEIGENEDSKLTVGKIAEYWWEYPANGDKMLQKHFKRHAAEVYAAAIAVDDINGLEKERGLRRIDEAKKYEDGLLEYLIKGEKAESSGKLYCVVDLSAGANATSYPVSYLPAAPKSGWTDEYKTTKLVLRYIEPENQTNEFHRVKITRPFYIGVFEVTQKQYELVMGVNPAYHKGGTRPVENVSWYTVRCSFMTKIRDRTGLKGFDLPDAAQWVYASRAGTSTFLNTGKEDTAANRAAVGRTVLNRGKGATAAVGSYLPNAWGLYDMHGNVTEWCLDGGRGKHAAYGGSWRKDVLSPLSPSARASYGTSWGSDFLGFRLLRRVE